MSGTLDKKKVKKKTFLDDRRDRRINIGEKKLMTDQADSGKKRET